MYFLALLLKGSELEKEDIHLQQNMLKTLQCCFQNQNSPSTSKLSKKDNPKYPT